MSRNRVGQHGANQQQTLELAVRHVHVIGGVKYYGVKLMWKPKPATCYMFVCGCCNLGVSLRRMLKVYVIKIKKKKRRKKNMPFHTCARIHSDDPVKTLENPRGNRSTDTFLMLRWSHDLFGVNRKYNENGDIVPKWSNKTQRGRSIERDQQCATKIPFRLRRPRFRSSSPPKNAGNFSDKRVCSHCNPSFCKSRYCKRELKRDAQDMNKNHQRYLNDAKEEDEAEDEKNIT